MTDKYEIAARVTIAGLDGFTGELHAAEQIRLFGRDIFGPKEITIDASGQGRVSWDKHPGETGHEMSFERIATVTNRPANDTRGHRKGAWYGRT